MTTNRSSRHFGIRCPIRALLLLRTSTELRSGSEILDRFAPLEDLARQYAIRPLRIRRRLGRATSFGPELLPWEQRLPELSEVDFVVIEDRTRISRSEHEVRDFVDCLERLEIPLLSLSDFEDRPAIPDEEEP